MYSIKNMMINVLNVYSKNKKVWIMNVNII
jgi:hypothetical protein